MPNAREQAERHVKAARYEKWFWMVFTVPYMALPAMRESVAVVGFLSVYALIKTCAGVERSSEAEVAGYAPDIDDTDGDDDGD